MKCIECSHEHVKFGPYAGQCFAQIDNDYRTCACTKFFTWKCGEDFCQCCGIVYIVLERMIVMMAKNIAILTNSLRSRVSISIS